MTDKTRAKLTAIVYPVAAAIGATVGELAPGDLAGELDKVVGAAVAFLVALGWISSTGDKTAQVGGPK